MAGLLDSLSASIGGLLGTPSGQSPWIDLLASGVDPNRGQKKLDAEQQARRDEWMELQKRETEARLEEFKRMREREDTTRAMLQAYSANPQQFQTPEAQSMLRAHTAGFGDPQLAEAGGMVQPQMAPMKPPSSFQEYALGQQDPGYAQFLQSQQASAQAAPANVQEWQFFNSLGPEDRQRFLEMKRGGYDTGAIMAAATAKATGAAVGTEQGKQIGQAPKLEQASREVEAIMQPGGLLEQATGSGIGSVADSLAGWAGFSTPGAQAIASLAPIADLVLKQVPRFEGPQSDKDTESYHKAAGKLSDPTVPYEQKKAAAAVIVRLMRERVGQFNAAAGNAADPKAELNAMRAKHGLPPI